MASSHPLLREIYDSQGALAARLALCLLFAVFGLIVAWIAVAQGGRLDGLVSGGLLFLCGALPMWPLAKRVFTIASPVIAMDEVGFFDRRISEQFHRWDDITAITLVRRGRTLGVNLQLPTKALTPRTFAFARVQNLVANLRRLFGRPTVHIYLAAGGTQVDGQQLYDWCQAYSRTHKFEVDEVNV